MNRKHVACSRQFDFQGHGERGVVLPRGGQSLGVASTFTSTILLSSYSSIVPLGAFLV